ncbi:MAG: M48 family metalloprotease [Mariprofundaceae bacterium]
MKQLRALTLFAAFLFCPPAATAFDFGQLGDALGIDPSITEHISQGAKVASALIPISDEEEITLGRDVAARVIGRFGLDKNLKQTYYLNLVGRSLAQRSDRPDLPYRFAILATNDVNAYSCPGGYIFVTRGALDMVHNEAELAAVLAHEIAHVTEKHIINALQHSKLMKVGGEVAAEAFKQGGELFQQMSDFATDALFKGLKKTDEYASDRKSLEYLDHLGYDYPAMFSVLKELDQRRRQGRAKVLAKTHPSPKSRISQLKQAESELHLDQPTGIRLKARFIKYLGKHKKA